MNSSHGIVELTEYKLVTTIAIQWGDQDAFGHVNNTVPIRWFESARIEYMSKAGWDVLSPGEFGPILASVNCNYRRQVKYPDTVHIGSRVTRIGRSSMTLAHAVVSDNQQAVVVDGETVVVAFNYKTQTSLRIPDDIRASIESLEERTAGSFDADL